MDSKQDIRSNSLRAVDIESNGLEISGKYPGVQIVFKRGKIIDTFTNYFLTLYKNWIKVEFESNHYWYPISDLVSMVEYNPRKKRSYGDLKTPMCTPSPHDEKESNSFSSSSVTTQSTEKGL